MPLYEYNCKECGAQEDRFATIERRDDQQDCAECGGDMKRKVGYAFVDNSLHFKIAAFGAFESEMGPDPI